MTINLKKLDKAEVLAALYNASKPQGLGFLHATDEPMSAKQAKKILKKQTDFDYLQGRVMKINLGGDELDPRGYDYDNGEGAAQAAIDSLKETGDVNNPAIAKTHSDNTFLSASALEPLLGSVGGVVSDPDEDVIEVRLGFEGFRKELGPKVKKAKEDNKDR